MNDLPQAPLSQVLGSLTLQDRLRCALVCSSWAAAGGPATRSIEAHTASHTQLAGLLQWLAVHGESVTRLLLHCGTRKTVIASALPCPQLWELVLENASGQLVRTGGRPAGLLEHAAKSLTQLQLRQVSVVGGVPQQQVAAALSALTNLQHLVLRELESGTRYVPLPRLLSHLVQLTYLEVACGLSDAAVEQLSCLCRLQHMQLERLGAATTAAALAPLAGLTNSLKCLCLEGAHFCIGSSSSGGSLVGLEQLTALQLHACDAFEPALLRTLTALQRLQLELTPVAGGAAGTAQLLELLPNLRQLTAVQLGSALTHDDGTTAPAAAAYSALTAGSRLQQLALRHVRGMPAEAWDSMFPQQQLNRQPTYLSLSNCTPCMSQLAGLVRSCPCVEALVLDAAVKPGASHAGLLQLPQLTSLSLSHAGDDTVEGVLAQLTRLSCLCILPPSHVTAAGLLHLTALRQLARLEASSEALQQQPGLPGSTMMGHVSFAALRDDAVWAQLQRWCLQGRLAAL